MARPKKKQRLVGISEATYQALLYLKFQEQRPQGEIIAQALSEYQERRAGKKAEAKTEKEG